MIYIQCFTRSNILNKDLDHTSIKIRQIFIPNFEKVILFDDNKNNIEGIIVIHDTTFGPALGGCRIHYYNRFSLGLDDALSLAQKMTYKNALMSLPFGGGKAVFFSNHNVEKIFYFNVLAKVLNKLSGEYITTDDMGCSVNDMSYLRQFTPYVRGELYQGKQITATSFGLYQSIKATLYSCERKNSLKGIKIIIQGLGKVGFPLCQYLYKENCKLYVDDLDPTLVSKAVKYFNATSISLEKLNKQSVDFFCPCAVGGIINKTLLSKLQVRYIVSGANNPLTNDSLADYLHDKGIVYLPDYLCNAGGVLDIACEGNNYCEQIVFKKVSKIYSWVTSILEQSKLKKQSPLTIANQIVNKKLVKNKLNKKVFHHA